MQFAILQQSPPPQALQQNEEGPWHDHPHPRTQACAATSPSQSQLHKHHQLSEPRTLPLATESCKMFTQHPLSQAYESLPSWGTLEPAVVLQAFRACHPHGSHSSAHDFACSVISRTTSSCRQVVTTERISAKYSYEFCQDHTPKCKKFCATLMQPPVSCTCTPQGVNTGKLSCRT